jgi:predicted ATPase
LTCAPGPDDDDRRHAEYEIGIYPPGDGLPWEVRYEALRRFDDFDEVEVLQREGATVTYKLTAPKRGPAPRRPTAREVVSRDMSALAVKTDLYEDPAVLPFARALALWSRYRRVDASPASPARAPSIFASFHERLWEGGGNLISALHNLTDIAHTRGPLEAALREAVPGHEALGFKALPDGTLALTHRLRGVDHRPPELPDEALRALCVVAALLSTAPPPLLWFEADFWDIPASMHGFAAECLVALSARARVVLVDPPEGLRAAVAAEVQRQRREGWRAESLHVADGPAGTTAEVRAFGGDAGVSPPR